MSKWRLLAASFSLICGVAVSADTLPPAAATPQVKKTAAPAPLPFRPITAVTQTGAGQAGYVHYFIITHPDETLEYQVGIELDDGRIAWSFPGNGVAVSPFVQSGTLAFNGETFGIVHLFGIRPFADDAAMRTLQDGIAFRVAQWVEDETPYCVFRTPASPYCMNCADFVARVLWPGHSPHLPALPRNLSGKSSDDLLLYLAGLNQLPNNPARLARIRDTAMPRALREELYDLVQEMNAGSGPATASTNLSRVASAPNQAIRKPARKVTANRSTQNKKL